jgi:hypothetical protein
VVELAIGSWLFVGHKGFYFSQAFTTARSLVLFRIGKQTSRQRYAAFMRHVYEKNEAVVGEGYAISGNSFDLSESSSSSVDRHRKE